MTQRKWPSFETWDLDLDTDEGGKEMQRRWETYDREMKALIARGGVHQDGDGWWIDDATGELIGPDPEIERPLTDEQLAHPTTFEQAVPGFRRGRGRPKSERPKAAITLRLDPDTVARFEASGPDWRRRMAEILDHAKP